MYSSSYMFRHHIAILRERPSAFWDMLNWAVDRILWMGVLFSDVVRAHTPIQNILSTAPQLSISQKALGTLPEDGNVMQKHVAATIHN
jgi:hypothetical protein